LTNGTVLIAGGYDSNVNAESSAEIYDPVAATFSATGNLNVGRDTQTATRLIGGTVLISGGYDINGNSLASAELYQPATLIPPGLVSIAVSPASPSLAVGAIQPFIATGTFSDNSTQILASASWSSSDNTIATITNDLGDPGQVYAVALGSTTVSACTGSVCGSTTVTVAPPPPSITSISPASGTIGTVVTLTGSNFGAAQGSSTVTFNSAAAPVTSWTASSIGVLVPPGTTTGNVTVAVTVSGAASNGWNFTLLPSLASVAVQPSIPGMLIGGTQQFTATGTYTDGSTQNITTLVNWTSNNSGVATVSASGLATGIASGNATIAASLGSVSSSVSLTVDASSTAPSITVQVSPAPNANGWNNSNVTVTFTCTAGSAAVTSCPATQVVSSEGAGQVISGTATDSNGRTATTSVTLNIDKTIPVLSVISPADGTGFSTSSVAVTGTVTDALSGVSAVTCNGAAASFSSSNFSCNISLTVGVNLLAVRATDLAGNVAGSNLHLTLVGTLPTPQSLQVTPATVNMLTADTQQFTAVDEQGRPRFDATWIISDTTLATIDTNSSPTLTALAPGQVTLTATVQGATAQAQINILNGSSLAPGTVRWSASGGFTCGSIVQAAPVSSGTPDLYCVNGGFVAAFTSDGQMLWQTTVPNPNGTFSTSIPDGFGGLLLRSNSSFNGSFLVDLDPITGQPTWQFTPSASTISLGNVAIGQDGTVYTEADTCQSGICSQKALAGIDGQTGAQRLAVSLPVIPSQPATLVGPLTINSDGSVNFEVGVQTLTNIGLATEIQDTLSQYQIQPSGVSSTLVLNSFDIIVSNLSGFCIGAYRSIPARVMPDGQTGTLALWMQPLSVCSSGPKTVTVSHSASSGMSSFNLPLNGNTLVPDQAMVLGENGTAFATDGATAVSFMTSGQINWTYQAPTDTSLSFVATSHGGGVLATAYSAGTGQLISLDSAGVPTFTFTGNDIQASWTGNLDYLAAATGSLNRVYQLPLNLIDWASSFWAAPNGNPSPTGASAELPWYPPLPSCPGSNTPCAGESTWNAFKALKALMAGPACSLCNTYVFSKLSKTQQQFSSFLNLTPLLSDGTRSNAPMNHVMCNWYDITCPFGSETVAAYMARTGSNAISRTPSPTGPVIFITPGTACTAGTSPGTLLNEANLFHEALHGFTGLYDIDLATALGVDYASQGSIGITYYLENNVFGATLTYHDPGGNLPLVCQN
jgi:hypothetical protein